jgi:transposase InsO family protein
MQERMTTQLVVDALMMAVWRRGKPVLRRPVQSAQYTSEHFQKLLDEQGITCSMSRAGEVWDNSAMESFFSSLKTERPARKVYRPRGQARSDVFDYIECFYNPTRRLRRSANSVPYSSSKLEKLRSVSMEPAAAHSSGDRRTSRTSDWNVWRGGAGHPGQHHASCGPLRVLRGLLRA